MNFNLKNYIPPEKYDKSKTFFEREVQKFLGKLKKDPLPGDEMLVEEVLRSRERWKISFSLLYPAEYHQDSSGKITDIVLFVNSEGLNIPNYLTGYSAQ